MPKKKDYIESDFEWHIHSSQEFKDYFLKEFCDAPKQRKKATKTLQKILNKLSNYDEPFAINLMETSILNDYQGVTFSDTDGKYKRYLEEKSRINNSNQASVFSRKTGKHNYINEVADHLDKSLRGDSDS